jgi:hypothetical protein
MDDSKRRVRYDNVISEMYIDLICQAPNLNETEKALCMHETRKKLE